MSLYDKASLIQVPSLYKDGLLVSTVPEDRSGDFTFSRGSNLSATRINEQGYIEKGYENLLLQSNTFSAAAWTKFQSSVTNGQSGYDGSNNAWLLTATASSNTAITQSKSLSSVVTLSVYAKANTANFIIIRLDGPVNTYAFIDLTDGSVGTKINSPISVNTESVGNGWYRCSITAANTSAAYIYICDANGSVNVTNGSSIYIQDAMLNQGLVAYPYIETTTAPVAGGILEDMPRLDWSGSCPSLLLEPSRTNLVPQSEYLTNTIRSTITHNQGTSPEGLQNAFLAVDSTDLNSHIVGSGNVNLGTSDTAVFSIFAKKQNNRYINLRITDDAASTGTGINFYNATFDLESGVVTDDYEYNTPTNPFSDVEDYGNGWYRCWVGLTKKSGAARTDYAVYLVNSSSAGVNPAYAGTGNDGNYLYGYQLEQDATYETSYIPTYGVSQTRLEDLATDAGDVNTFNSTEGVLYFEGERLSLLGEKRTISISDGSLNNYLYIQFQGVSNTVRIFYKTIETGQVLLLNHNLNNELGLNKYAFRWSNNNFSLWINGTKELEQLNGSTATSSVFSELNFALGNGLDKFYGKTKQVLVFKQALSDSECIALTTIT